MHQVTARQTAKDCAAHSSAMPRYRILHHGSKVAAALTRSSTRRDFSNIRISKNATLPQERLGNARPKHGGSRRRFSSNSRNNTSGSDATRQSMQEFDQHAIPNSVLAQRALMAAGMIYYFGEYCYSITLCEGPSMWPTIPSSGEIVLMDKWSVRKYGVQDGTIGEERAKQARSRQEAFAKNTQHGSGGAVWHQPHISIDNLGPASWRDIYHQICSPLSVGDVVVVHHPQRKGTVCKRVLGLPGDAVLPRSNGRVLIVPDGHIWLEGDNPANSADSRAYGAVPIPLLVGRVVCSVWPLTGQATLRRGASPRPRRGTPHVVYNSTVLPAGYDGEHILKQPVVEELEEQYK